jgi:Rieske Fe-S protein
VTTEGISRRNAIAGAAAVGIGVPLVAACDSGGSGGSGGSTPSAAAGEKLGPASDVPVGGGKIYGDQQVVVTQPTQGSFEGFGAVCTHQGCLVSTVSDGTINCACHGSRFSIKDGSVVNGPASSPLPKVKVKVSGGEVTTA